MSTIAPSPFHVAAEVASLRRRRPEAEVLGLFLPAPWTGPDVLEAEGERLPVRWCATPLAVSEALSERREGERLVLLSGTPETSLSRDVLARLPGRRLERIDPWRTVAELFRAADVDPRIRKAPWMADVLVARRPLDGYPPAPAGVLDLDTAWQRVLERLLGLGMSRPDAVSLLSWSLRPEHRARFAQLDLEARAAIAERFEAGAGKLGWIVARALEAGTGDWLLPVGIVCEVLFAPDRGDNRDVLLLQGRLEVKLGDIHLDPMVGRQWCEAASTVLASLDDSISAACLAQGAAMLEDLRASELAAYSSLLPQGLDHRLAKVADGIHASISGRGDQAELDGAIALARAHREARRHPDRFRRLEMAARLVRRLTAAPAAPKSLAEAAGRYVEDGGFVDWARRVIAEGDPHPGLSDALIALADRLRALREDENRTFGMLLADWNEVPVTSGKGILGIERVLEEIVAPLGSLEPTLVIVLDGMSMANFIELQASLRERNWLALRRNPAVEPVLAILPSVTELSRASLLAGRVKKGSQADEKKTFAAHPALRKASGQQAPVLFHKAELFEPGSSSLSQSVRAEIANRRRRIVGMVINAIDDHLSKSDQVRLDWTVDRILPLADALHAAAQAGRVVILTSDHGHVLEHGLRALQGEPGERYRFGSGEPAHEELTVSGPRISAALDRDDLIVPWSERVRYGAKKNGYHGGATPQELVVPLGVYVPLERAQGDYPSLETWGFAPEFVPLWWSSQQSLPLAVPTKRTAPKRKSTTIGPLFDAPQQWTEALFQSPIYESQRRMAGRSAPADEVIRKVVSFLDDRQGTASLQALAQHLAQPELRLRGLIATLARVLNVDGYQILQVDEPSQSVRLDASLLRKQFGL